MRLPAMPVRSGADATLDFDYLSKRLAAIEKSYGSGYRLAEQKVPNLTWTQIKLDTVLHNEGGHFDFTTGWYNVPAEGVYQITGWASIVFAGEPAVEYIVSIVVGAANSEAARGTRFSEKMVGEGILNGTASCIRKCAAGDKIGLSVFQNSGAERAIEFNAARQNRLDVIRIV